MASYGREASIGARIAAARRARGFRTTKELAIAMDGSGVTAAILENIESGRKATLDVTHVLNIAMALGVPISSLLAPMARPADSLDLRNLGAAFEKMTAAEFDAWLSGVTNGGYSPRTSVERNDRAELNALRELSAARHELERVSTVADLGKNEGLPVELLESQGLRIEALRLQIDKLVEYLRTAGWAV